MQFTFYICNGISANDFANLSCNNTHFQKLNVFFAVICFNVIQTFKDLNATVHADVFAVSVLPRGTNDGTLPKCIYPTLAEWRPF